jgi:hypothetical protein
MKRVAIFLLTCAALSAQIGRPLLDAHNCYPYEGLYKNRIDRALSMGFPVAIEQDIGYFEGRAVVTHTDKTTGAEPTLKEHFFERVRPIVEKALRDNNRDQWPIIVLHFDFKDLKEPTLRAAWDVLKEYEPWLVTATKPADASKIEPFEKKPILVLTEDPDAQQAIFFDEVPVGGKLRIFGSAHTKDLTARADVYHRWLNYSWHEIEPEGQPKAGAWTEEKNARLKQVVDNAHKLGYWIRFYTLDGYDLADNQGWFQTYNFGSRTAVEARWKAVMDAGVDMIASDQYEALGAFMRGAKGPVVKVAAPVGRVK